MLSQLSSNSGPSNLSPSSLGPSNLGPVAYPSSMTIPIQSLPMASGRNTPQQISGGLAGVNTQSLQPTSLPISSTPRPNPAAGQYNQARFTGGPLGGMLNVRPGTTTTPGIPVLPGVHPSQFSAALLSAIQRPNALQNLGNNPVSSLMNMQSQQSLLQGSSPRPGVPLLHVGKPLSNLDHWMSLDFCDLFLNESMLLKSKPRCLSTSRKRSDHTS